MTKSVPSVAFPTSTVPGNRECRSGMYGWTHGECRLGYVPWTRMEEPGAATKLTRGRGDGVAERVADAAAAGCDRGPAVSESVSARTESSKGRARARTRSTLPTTDASEVEVGGAGFGDRRRAAGVPGP